MGTQMECRKKRSLVSSLFFSIYILANVFFKTMNIDLMDSVLCGIS